MAAAFVFLAVAEDAAAAVKAISPQSVEIAGRGLIAQQVRLLVGAPSETPVERPQAIVDTTGDPSVIAHATRRVADLGTVVLAGEPLGRQFELNLYPDVHVRGLTLVGVAPPLHRNSFGDLIATAIALSNHGEICLFECTSARSFQSAPPGIESKPDRGRHPRMRRR